MPVIPQVMRLSLGREVITKLSQCRELPAVYLEAIQMTSLILLSQTLIEPLMFHFNKKSQSIWSCGTERVHSSTPSTICIAFLSRKRAEQLSIFSSVATITFSNGYKLLAPCHSLGGCKEGPEKRSQKTVHKIFPGFLPILCLLFPLLPLVERRNSLWKDRWSIYLDEMI